MSIVTEVGVWDFRCGERPIIPRGWDVFHAEKEEGILTVYARRGVHVDHLAPENATTETVKRTDAHIRRSPLAMPVRVRP